MISNLKLKARINCDPNSLHGWVDPDCTTEGDVKKYTISKNQSDCNYLITPGVLTNNTRFYGPFGDVFNEKNTNFDLYKRMGPTFEQLEKGYNIIFLVMDSLVQVKHIPYQGSDRMNKNAGITQLAIKRLKNERGYTKITCKVRELAPGHTHSRIIYYKPDKLKGNLYESGSGDVVSWKWGSEAGKAVFQPGKKYADLSQGTIFKEVPMKIKKYLVLIRSMILII